MVCPKCKAKIKDRSNFCSKCGAKCGIIATDNSKSDIQKQENKKHGTFMISLVISIIGGLIVYLSVFHDAFGGASGFTAIIGGVFLAAGCCGVFGIPIDEFTRGMDENWEEKKKIERLNHEWNDAQRDYDRYNHSIKK